jgi:hypothetical protein
MASQKWISEKAGIYDWKSADVEPDGIELSKDGARLTIFPARNKYKYQIHYLKNNQSVYAQVDIDQLSQIIEME